MWVSKFFKVANCQFRSCHMIVSLHCFNLLLLKSRRKYRTVCFNWWCWLLLIQNSVECCLFEDSGSRWMVLRANVYFCTKNASSSQSYTDTPFKYTISREIVYFTHHQTDFCNRYQCIKSCRERVLMAYKKSDTDSTHALQG